MTPKDDEQNPPDPIVLEKESTADKLARDSEHLLNAEKVQYIGFIVNIKEGTKVPSLNIGTLSTLRKKLSRYSNCS
jgi:hypothetical protein